MVALFDEAAPRPPPQHVLGQELGALSLHELSERIAALQAEIERLEAARVAKEKSRAQADAVFRS